MTLNPRSSLLLSLKESQLRRECAEEMEGIDSFVEPLRRESSSDVLREKVNGQNLEALPEAYCTEASSFPLLGELLLGAALYSPGGETAAGRRGGAVGTVWARRGEGRP